MGIVRETEQHSPGSDHNATIKPLLGDSPRSANEIRVEKAGDESNLNETSVYIRDPSEPIKDRFYMIYLILLLFGIASLLPWNIFITATDVRQPQFVFQINNYFIYLFRLIN